MPEGRLSEGLLSGVRIVECSMLGPAELGGPSPTSAPRSSRSSRRRRLRAPDDVADRRGRLAAAPAHQPGQASRSCSTCSSRRRSRCSSSSSQDADAVIEAMRPGVLAKRGLGYERLKEINPRIVFCTISGYGMTGPYKDMPQPRHRVRHVGRHRARRRTTTTASATSPSTPSIGINAGPLFGALGIARRHRAGRARPASGCQHGDRAVRRRGVLRLVPHRDVARRTSGPRTRSPATPADNFERRAARHRRACRRASATSSTSRPTATCCSWRRSRRSGRTSARASAGMDLFEQWPGEQVRRPRPRQPRAAGDPARHLPHEDDARSGSTFGNEHNTPIAPVNTPKTIIDDPQFQDRFPWIRHRSSWPTSCRSR